MSIGRHHRPSGSCRKDKNIWPQPKYRSPIYRSINLRPVHYISACISELVLPCLTCFSIVRCSLDSSSKEYWKLVYRALPELHEGVEADVQNNGQQIWNCPLGATVFLSGMRKKNTHTHKHTNARTHTHTHTHTQINDRPVEVNSHIACSAHAISLACRAAKCLDCVFPIWFKQCGRVWFTFSMPCPCRAHAVLRPCLSERDFSRPLHSAARSRRAMCELAFTIHEWSQPSADPDTKCNRHVDPLTVPNFTSRKLTCWSLVLT